MRGSGHPRADGQGHNRLKFFAIVPGECLYKVCRLTVYRYHCAKTYRYRVNVLRWQIVTSLA
ncbi:hypothetical protein EMIT0215P_180026 [Pseudomonas serboccidentalis]